MNWISVHDGLPKENTYIFSYIPHYGNRISDTEDQECFSLSCFSAKLYVHEKPAFLSGRTITCSGKDIVSAPRDRKHTHWINLRDIPLPESEEIYINFKRDRHLPLDFPLHFKEFDSRPTGTLPWIFIEEEMPKFGEYVFVFIPEEPPRTHRFAMAQYLNLSQKASWGYFKILQQAVYRNGKDQEENLRQDVFCFQSDISHWIRFSDITKPSFRSSYDT